MKRCALALRAGDGRPSSAERLAGRPARDPAGGLGGRGSLGGLGGRGGPSGLGGARAALTALTLLAVAGTAPALLAQEGGAAGAEASGAANEEAAPPTRPALGERRSSDDREVGAILSEGGPPPVGGSGAPTAPLPEQGVDGTIVSRDVEVRDGDTLTEIARRELGSVGLARPLAEYNELDVDATLETGRLVRVPVHVPPRGESATVVFAKGEVRRDDTPLERGTLVNPGDTLFTGADGFASLEFASGTVVNLQPDSAVTLERLACIANDDSCLIDIDAAGGELHADVKSRDGQPSEFRVATPFASAAVRGTEFGIGIEGEATIAEVTEGSVVVEAQQQPVTLDSGFGSVTRAGEPPGEPVPLPPAPVFRTVPNRAAPGDAIVWFPLRGVDAYLLTLSLDSDGNRTVAEYELGGSRFEVPEEIDDEIYYVGVRGLLSNGLAGFRATARLGFVAIDADVAPPAVTVTREGAEFLVEVVDPAEDASGYEIQVATTPDFADPLSVEVAPTGRAVLRIEADTLHARARTLIDPETLSRFGPTASGR